MKRQVFLINHGTYPFDIVVDIGSSQEELEKFLRKKFGYELSGEEQKMISMRGVGRTVIFEGGQTILRVAILKEKSKFHANLAHEIFHAVEFLFDRVNLKHHIDSGEAWAYQIQLLTKEIYSRIT